MSATLLLLCLIFSFYFNSQVLWYYWALLGDDLHCWGSWQLSFWRDTKTIWTSICAPMSQQPPKQHYDLLWWSYFFMSLSDSCWNQWQNSKGHWGRGTDEATEIKWKAFHYIDLRDWVGKWSGLSDVRVSGGGGSRQKCRREMLLNTWMEFVSIHSLMARRDISSLFCCTTSHHTTEDLATDTRHAATLPFHSWFPLLDSKVRNIFM